MYTASSSDSWSFFHIERILSLVLKTFAMNKIFDYNFQFDFIKLISPAVSYYILNPCSYYFKKNFCKPLIMCWIAESCRGSEKACTQYNVNSFVSIVKLIFWAVIIEFYWPLKCIVRRWKLKIPTNILYILDVF